ncbi:MAG: HAD hydrolase-like protein [Clostridia bacterium]|nr:HAD hydrolase-like protein [Clostridia bacterium]
MNNGCVMFDLDGTLFDSSEGIKMSYRKGLEHFGIEVENDSELDKVIGPSLYDSYHRFFGLEGEDLLTAVKIYRDLYGSEGIYRLKMYDGVENMLDTVKQNGFIVCLASAKPYVMAHKILDFTGILPYFDVICGSNLDGSMSDKVELIEECLKQSRFTDKSRAYMVGDRSYDMIGAAKTGVHSIGVTYGFGTRMELMEAGAEFIAYDTGNVSRILIDRYFDFS